MEQLVFVSVVVSSAMAQSRPRLALEWTLDQFTGSNYYFMFPLRSFLRKRFINELKCATMDDDNLTDELKQLKEVALR